MDDLFSRGDFYTVEAGSHLMLCGRIVSGKMAKKGGWYHRKLSAMGLSTEEWEEEGGYHQVVTWNLPEGTRVVVACQLLICV